MTLFSLQFRITPYDHEPSCSTAEKRGIKFAKSADSRPMDQTETTSNDVDLGRLHTTSWCWCGKCQVMDSLRECVCCWEMERANVLVRDSDLSCVTLLENFNQVCLNKDVLETAIATKRIMAGLSPGDANRNNSHFRHQAYANFINWLYKNSLGRSHRVVLPACVVLKVRAVFPNPPSEPYVGFLESYPV